MRNNHNSHRQTLVFDDKNETVTLNYLYPYEIDLARVRTERDLLAWSLHLCEKTWMDTLKLHEVITEIGKKKGFKIYGL